jgi:RNA polymerase sigma factor (sigma-70 family)
MLTELAFAQIYNQYQKKVFRFFLKRILNHETARELTQEVFVKLWKGGEGVVIVSLETRLFTIAGSILIDHLRRQAHERKRLSGLAHKISSESSLVQPSPHRAFETADYLKVVVRDLPPARKKIILLKMGSGFTNKEIASQLSISEKTVEDHVTKALRHIRAILTLLVFYFLSGRQ